MKSTIDKLKAISRAFNSSDSIEQFAVNLDLSLAGISVDEAERLYADQCRDIIKHMSPFWCENRKFSFKKALSSHFDSYYFNISHFALPYGMASLKDKDVGDVIKIYVVDLNGREIEQHAIVPSIGLSKDIFVMPGIDVLHETILTLMCEITKEMGGGN